MLNPGTYTLGSLSITAALSAQAQTAIDDLDGMTAVTLESVLAYGSGGTSVAAVVQTSLDGGTLWRDVARFDFTTASATKHATLSGLLSKAVTSYATLSSESVYDSVLGDRLRLVVTSVGTYANTTLTVRAAVR